MTLDDLSRFISQLGFPIFVAVYLLVVGSRQHAENTEAVRGLASMIQSLHDLLERKM